MPEDVPTLLAMTAETGMFKPIELGTLSELFCDYFAHDDVDGHRCICLCDESRILGYAYFGPEKMTQDSWCLYWIVTSKQHQSQGIGTAILRHVESEIRSAGGRPLFVETSSLPHYEPTRRFYLKHQYEQEAVLRDYYSQGDHKVVFRKDLTQW
jgi:GNAT superfamily N-acetyltransferase